MQTGLSENRYKLTPQNWYSCSDPLLKLLVTASYFPGFISTVGRILFEVNFEWLLSFFFAQRSFGPILKPSDFARRPLLFSDFPNVALLLRRTLVPL